MVIQSQYDHYTSLKVKTTKVAFFFLFQGKLHVDRAKLKLETRKSFLCEREKQNL